MSESLSGRRLRLGRVQVYIEPRDIWVGVYVAPQAIYACPLPFVVLRWDRHRHDPIECACELTAADAPAPTVVREATGEAPPAEMGHQ